MLTIRQHQNKGSSRISTNYNRTREIGNYESLFYEIVNN